MGVTAAGFLSPWNGGAWRGDSRRRPNSYGGIATRTESTPLLSLLLCRRRPNSYGGIATFCDTRAARFLVAVGDALIRMVGLRPITLHRGDVQVHTRSETPNSYGRYVSRPNPRTLSSRTWPLISRPPSGATTGFRTAPRATAKLRTTPASGGGIALFQLHRSCAG